MGQTPPDSVLPSLFWHRPSNRTGQYLHGVPGETMEAVRERTTERPTGTAVDCSLRLF